MYSFTFQSFLISISACHGLGWLLADEVNGSEGCPDSGRWWQRLWQEDLASQPQDLAAPSRPVPPCSAHSNLSHRCLCASLRPEPTSKRHSWRAWEAYGALVHFAISICFTNLQHNSIPRVYSALTPSGMKSLLQFEGLWYLFMCEFLGLNSTSKDPKVSMELLFPAWIASSTYLPSCSPSTLGWFQIWTVPGRQPDEILCVVMEWYGMIPALPKHTFGVLAHISSPWSAV